MPQLNLSRALGADTFLHVLQRCAEHGVEQTVHCLIATYNEGPELVKECVLRLLVAPEPIYMEKLIYICDDGSAKEEGKAKRAMVEDLRSLGARSHAQGAVLFCMSCAQIVRLLHAALQRVRWLQPSNAQWPAANSAFGLS